MKKQIVNVEPVFKERIWGGTQMRTRFHGHTELDRIGEMWSVAALKGNGDNRLSEIDMSLSEAYEKLPDWFDCSSQRFPIRCTLMDPIDNLSVQVHPDDDYAQKNHDSYGKPEAWYFLETKGNHKLLFGHNAQTPEEFRSLAQSGQWDKLLNYVNVNAGDFIYVPAGTLHATGKHMLTFEISRNADVTYRIWDYDRIDVKTGQPRDLHFDQGMDVMNIPFNEKGPIHPTPVLKRNILITSFFDQPGIFTLSKIQTLAGGTFDFPYFYFLTIIDGEGKVDTFNVKPGTTLLIPSGFGDIHLEGKLTGLVSSYHD